MADKREDDSGEEQDPEEYEAQGQWKLIDLPEVSAQTGEEQEEELTKFRTKLYRFRDKEWKERGVGELRFLKHKINKKIRVIMRQDKTLLTKLNFYVKGPSPFCILSELKTQKNCWVFSCLECSEEPLVEKLCTRFTSAEENLRFKEVFEKARESNDSLEQNQNNDPKDSKSEENKPEKLQKQEEDKKED